MGVCRNKARIRAPLPYVWEFLIKPENLHVWGPATRPVTGFDRPLQAGDRLTFYRRDFFRNYSQRLLVEKIDPYHSLHMRDLSNGAARVTLSVEETGDRESTWVEEAIFYTLGSGRVLQWFDRWLINPILNLIVAYKSNKVFRRLQTILDKPHSDSILESDQEEQKGAWSGSGPS
jgi:ligand-binding SRPBCC domain-containing protein